MLYTVRDRLTFVNLISEATRQATFLSDAVQTAVSVDHSDYE